MAIVVETGEGLSNAQAYIDAAYLQSFAALRAFDLSGYDTPAQEAAIIIAAQDWLDGQHTFANEKLTEGQALDFPRTVYGLPNEIKIANAKAALLQLQGLLLVDTSVISVNGDIESESSSMGSLSDSVTYRTVSSQRYGRVLPVDLTMLLQPYLYGSMGGLRRW